MKKIVKKIEHLFKALYGTLILRVKYRKKMYFLCNRGIGDTVIFLSKLADYRKIYPENRVNIIIQNSHKEIAEGYKNLLDSIAIVSNKMLQNFNKAALYGWLPSNITFILPQNGFELLENENCSIVNLVNMAMQLEIENYNYASPKFEWDEERKKEILVESGAIKGHSIIISPYAFSVPEIDIMFWNEIVREYVCKGYQVITNLKDDKEVPLKGTRGIALSLDETYLLAEYCGHFIGLRSGLCDLLAYSTCKMTVVYPASKGKDWRKKYSFSKMHFRKNIEEIREEELKKWLLNLEGKLSEKMK